MKSFKISHWVVRFILFLGVIISIFPFYWMIVMASRTQGDLFSVPPILTIGSELINNIKTVLITTNFVPAFFNTIFIASVSTTLTLFFASLAGFTFAKLKFPGRKILFTILLATMMIPGQMNVVPLYLIMDRIGWLDSYQALIIPGMAGAFGIFWIKQYTEDAIHDSLLESARIDGCSTFRIYWNIALPMLKPPLSFLAVFTFMGSWNDFMWPMLIIEDESKYTLMLALSRLQGLYSTNYPLVISGTLLATIPLIILFVIFSKQLIAGVGAGGVKE